MGDDKYNDLFLMISSIVTAFMLGAILCFLLSDYFDKTLATEAIERNYAVYHPQTGEFTWKCDLENEETTNE